MELVNDLLHAGVHIPLGLPNVGITTVIVSKQFHGLWNPEVQCRINKELSNPYPEPNKTKWSYERLFV